ncbi:MAG: hypothetical protein P8R42_16200 [Candidatus Binatia bacterium]|nr:hypothetical protein [Candidatus Binatia bacterium]
MSRLTVFAATIVLGAGLLLASLPQTAIAGSSGGRVYNSKRLRPRAETAARGRIIRDPRKAPTNPRQPAKRRALIPNPEKRYKGGSGYTKRGNYYYQTPKQIRAGGNTKRRVERIKIPHPNKKLR